jgi:hypothetical protein
MAAPLSSYFLLAANTITAPTVNDSNVTIGDNGVGVGFWVAPGV